MNKLLLKQGSVIFEDFITKADVLISGKKILRVAPKISSFCAPSLSVEGFYISPGFIDLHIHGGVGFDFLDASSEGNKKILDFVSSHGTTYLLPTIATAPLENMISAAKAVLELHDKRVGGIHFEGPFLSPKRKGAQPEQYLLAPTLDLYKKLRDAAMTKIRILALAPDLPGAKEVIAHAVRDNVVVALAHSDASYEEALDAIGYGITHFTHLYNGLRVFHHRDPGAVAAALLSPNVTVELIADGVHVHPAVVHLVVKLKGVKNVCLISDAIRATGLGEGRYQFSGQEISVEGEVVRLVKGESLAGSTLTLDKAIRNLLEWGFSLPDAVTMASLTPARILGVDQCKGTISSGKDADVVIFDRDLLVRAVFVEGQIVYNDLDEQLSTKERV